MIFELSLVLFLRDIWSMSTISTSKLYESFKYGFLGINRKITFNKTYDFAKVYTLSFFVAITKEFFLTRRSHESVIIFQRKL